MRLKAIFLRLPALLIAGLIWFLSSQSTLPQPVSFWGADKLAHLAAYAALGVAIGLWVSPAFWKLRPVWAVMLVILVGSVYGAVDEFHQYFVPGRDCNVWDWVADNTGAFLGALAMMVVMRKFNFMKKENIEGSNN